jgi:hypothetical protein
VIRRALLLVAITVGLVAAVALPLGLWRGPYQWLCAAVALGLTVLPGVLTLVAAERLGRGTPAARVLAVVGGTLVRVVLGFGGGVVVFLAAGPTFRADPISFWLWVLSAYLVALMTETSLLAGRRAADGSRSRTEG